MPQLLLDETSPYGTRRASLLQGDHDLYLFLADATSADAGTVSTVWVANTSAAPGALDRSGTAAGAPPRMGADGTLHPQGCPPPNGAMRLVWFEEGDGVALVDADGVIAAIPGWGGVDGFYGYARHARGQTPLAWELSGPVQAALGEKVEASRAFWQARTAVGAWDTLRAQGVAHLEQRLGPVDHSWSLNETQFPELVLTRHRVAAGSGTVFVTATTGLSAQRMAGVEQAVEDPSTCSRIELAFGRRVADEAAAAVLADVARIPSSRCTFLGDGHTVGGRPGAYAVFGPDKTALLLTSTPPAGPDGGPAPDLRGRTVGGDAVLPLWVIPVDDATAGIARANGGPAALAHLASQGVGWLS
ncbi:MAG TPA: suppressor of fused domain protein [Acidimicrobiales bacterium]